jgi:hypothetical protein
MARFAGRGGEGGGGGGGSRLPVHNSLYAVLHRLEGLVASPQMVQNLHGLPLHDSTLMRLSPPLNMNKIPEATRTGPPHMLTFSVQ